MEHYGTMAVNNRTCICSTVVQNRQLHHLMMVDCNQKGRRMRVLVVTKLEEICNKIKYNSYLQINELQGLSEVGRRQQ